MYSCLPVGNAGQGDAARVGDRAEHVGGGLDVGVRVLHVDRQPGKARPRHEPGRRDAPQRQPGPDLWFPGPQRSFDRILFQLSSSPQTTSKMTIARETLDMKRVSHVQNRGARVASRPNNKEHVAIRDERMSS